MDPAQNLLAQLPNNPITEIETSSSFSNIHHIGNLNGRAIAQVSNSLQRTFSRAIQSSEPARHFFNYLSANVSTVPLRNTESIMFSIDNVSRQAAHIFVDHVIPGARNIGDAVSHFASSLAQQPQIEIPTDGLGLETSEEDNYVMINTPGGRGETDALSRSELEDEELMKHHRNVSIATTQAHHEDKLLGQAVAHEEKEAYQRISADIAQYGNKIDRIAQELDSDIKTIETGMKNSAKHDL